MRDDESEVGSRDGFGNLNQREQKDHHHSPLHGICTVYMGCKVLGTTTGYLERGEVKGGEGPRSDLGG